MSQSEFNLNILIQQLQLLRSFRNFLVNHAIQANPKYTIITGKSRIKAVSKEKAHFTQWFYDNMLMGNIDFLQTNSASLTVNNFVIKSRNIVITEEKIKSYLELSTMLISLNSDSKTVSSDIIFTLHNEVITARYHSFEFQSVYNMYLLSKKRYVGNPNFLSSHLFALLAIYNTIEIDNNYLSVPQAVVGTLCDFEFFGSPFNTMKPYFSPFPYLERQFGSYGNFFTADFALLDGFRRFLFNPPFTELFFERAATRIIQFLQYRKERKLPASILAILPVWDPETQVLIGAPNFEAPLQGFTTIKNSPFLREHNVWRGQVKFYNYLTHSDAPITNLHICILATDSPEITVAQVHKYW